MLSLMMFKSSLVEAPPIPWSPFWDREALSALEVSAEAERARLFSCSGDAVWRWEWSLCQWGVMESMRLMGTHGISLCTNGSVVVPSLWTPLSPWGAFCGSFPAFESAHDAHCDPFPSRGRGTHLPRDAPASCPFRCNSTYSSPQISEILEGDFTVLWFQDRQTLISLTEYCCKTLFWTGVFCQIDWKFLAGMFNHHLINTDLR